MYAYGPAKSQHKATCTSGEECILFIAFQDAVDAFPPADDKAAAPADEAAAE